MKLSQLLENLPYGSTDVEIVDITNDSRKVKEGVLFVCINGSTVDGHKFAKGAADKGACAILAEHNVGVDSQVLVSDSKKAYAKVCSAFFGNPKDKLKLIGVTGTNGKTSTTMLIKSMLEKFGHKVGLIGTIENLIGDKAIPTENTTPDAYELHKVLKMMVDEGCEYVVMEVSSHALDQDRVYGLEFEAGVFTNLTQDHLDYHLTIENYAEAKRKLFDMTKAAIVNSDDEWSKAMTDGIKCHLSTYAVNDQQAEYLAKGIRYNSDGVVFELLSSTKIARVRLKTPGKFSVYNGLAAASCLITLGFDFEKTAQYLSECYGIKGRAEVVEIDKDFTVIIDYAHTPDGIKNILSTMNEIKKGRLVTLFGCGGDRDSSKRPKMGKMAADLSDFCIVTSDNPRTEDPQAIVDDILVGMKDTKTPYKVIVNREEAIKYALQNAQKDDIIILAGKGHETYQIIGKQKNHFDEREVVQKAIAELS